MPASHLFAPNVLSPLVNAELRLKGQIRGVLRLSAGSKARHSWL